MVWSGDDCSRLGFVIDCLIVVMAQQHELHPSQRSLPARSRTDALRDIQVLPDEHREKILAVLVAMRGRFWHLPRKLQVVALLRATRGRGLSQKVIAITMGWPIRT